jgi:hypothetical protein
VAGVAAAAATATVTTIATRIRRRMIGAIVANRGHVTKSGQELLKHEDHDEHEEDLWKSMLRRALRQEL